ncbi:MAG: DUF4936 family protein [Aquabacterium sp.]
METMSEVAPALVDTCPTRALYVYYRVPAAQAVAARVAIDAMQSTLRQLYPGLHARLMSREDASGMVPLEATWMEVYEHPQGVSRACELRLETLASALPDGVIGSRHVEVFVAVAAAAPAPAPVGAP